MKSSILLLLALLLTSAVLAPALITLCNSDTNSAFSMDFNEEEKKEEKKETSDNDFFIEGFIEYPKATAKNNLITDYYLEGNYNIALSVYSPPPKSIS